MNSVFLLLILMLLHFITNENFNKSASPLTTFDRLRMFPLSTTRRRSRRNNPAFTARRFSHLNTSSFSPYLAGAEPWAHEILWPNACGTRNEDMFRQLVDLRWGRSFTAPTAGLGMQNEHHPSSCKAECQRIELRCFPFQRGETWNLEQAHGSALGKPRRV